MPNSPLPNREAFFFQNLPERLRKIIIDLENNYKVWKREFSGIKLIPEILEKSKGIIFSNYQEKETKFLSFIFKILNDRTSHWIPFKDVENQYFYHFKEEKGISNISKKESKNRGIRGDPSPLSPKNVIKEEKKENYISIRDMPLYKVSEEIKGEIYKKGIYISKHCLEHFKTLSAKFDLVKNIEDINIYNKFEEHLKPDYNRFGWAWAIDKGKQAKLGICFNIQMHNKGTFIIFIKKNFKDVETFLEHYYRIFDFLDYEELGRLLDLFYISKENRKVFDYIHLANKIGPKQTIDKEWKGAHIKVEYFILKSGKKVLNVKIDYSDPHEPELEIEGPEAEGRNLRDILVNPSGTLPTISNIGDWARDNRNNLKDIQTQQTIITESLNDNGQILQLVQQDIFNNHQENLDQLTSLYEKLEYIKEEIPELKNALVNIYSDGSKERIVIRDSLVKLIVHLLNLDTNIQGNIERTKGLIQQTFLDTSSEIHNAKDEIVNHINSQLDSFKTELTNIINQEFTTIRKGFSHNLYLVLRAIHNLPDLTSQEIFNEIQEELSISRTTLYNYLQKLQDKGLINKRKMQLHKKGRPSHIFRISDKIINKFKKRGK